MGCEWGLFQNSFMEFFWNFFGLMHSFYILKYIQLLQTFDRESDILFEVDRVPLRRDVGDPIPSNILTNAEFRNVAFS